MWKRAGTVDEERRRSGDPAQFDGVSDARGARVRMDVVAENLQDEAEHLGLADQAAWGRGVLVVQQPVVHLPKPPCFPCLGRGRAARPGVASVWR